ncbi:MAG TPA: hypothetical protein PKY81_07325 [bacterium]|nr:hypothetical protein [bacterium]HPN30751.1 hypothetical protein [bacterium]
MKKILIAAGIIAGAGVVAIVGLGVILIKNAKKEWVSMGGKDKWF